MGLRSVGCSMASRTRPQVQSIARSFTAAHMAPWSAFTMTLATWLRHTSTRATSRKS